MTRKQLKAVDEERLSFSAVFGRFGKKTGWRKEEKTILLQNVCFATGEPACDHIWFTCGKTWDALDLAPGDRVTFDARVKRYEKGYAGGRIDVYKPIETDYKLSHPTKVRKATNDNGS